MIVAAVIRLAGFGQLCDDSALEMRTNRTMGHRIIHGVYSRDVRNHTPRASTDLVSVPPCFVPRHDASGTREPPIIVETKHARVAIDRTLCSSNEREECKQGIERAAYASDFLRFFLPSVSPSAAAASFAAFFAFFRAFRSSSVSPSCYELLLVDAS